MAKLIIGKTPEFFKPFLVKFELPEGGEDQILVTFKYRTNAQYAELINELYKSAGVEQPEDGKFDFVALYKKDGEKTAAHMAKYVHAWDLANPVNKESLIAIHNQVPAACAAFAASYRNACVEGKLGN